MYVAGVTATSWNITMVTVSVYSFREPSVEGVFFVLSWIIHLFTRVTFFETSLKIFDNPLKLFLAKIWFFAKGKSTVRSFEERNKVQVTGKYAKLSISFWLAEKLEFTIIKAVLFISASTFFNYWHVFLFFASQSRSFFQPERKCGVLFPKASVSFLNQHWGSKLVSVLFYTEL